MPAPVLFVDDSPFARAATSRLLGELGLPFVALGSVEEVRGVDPRTLAAALLDLELSDGDGTDAAAHLRAGAPALPIAFLTGGGPPALLAAARRLGPVFSKISDLDAAIAWVAAAAGGSAPT